MSFLRQFRGHRSAWFACALAACVAGCGKGTRTETAGDAGAVTSSGGIPAAQAARPLAKVGDRTITLGDFAAALEHMDQFDRLRYQSPERRLELLQEMIRVELLAQEAVEKGYDKDPLAAQELRSVLRDAVLEDIRKNAIAPVDLPAADVHAYFEAHRAEYKDPERRRVSVIVARDEAAANACIDAFKKNPTAVTWGELVRDRSIDPQARAQVPVDLAGDFGFTSPPGDSRGVNPRIPEELRAAAFAIPNVGELAPAPVKSGGKIFVVRLASKVDARERAFEEAERTIRVKLAQDLIEKKEEEMLANLRREHPPQIDENALANVRIDPNSGLLGAGADAGGSDAGSKP